MSQWREVLKMMQNATGGWISTHDIYDELGVKNPSQRIDEIERYSDYGVEREVIWIKGKRAARYKLRAGGPVAGSDRVAVQGASSPVAGCDRVVEQAPPAASPETLFPVDTTYNASHWKAA